MTHSTRSRPWLITESGFFYKLPARVSPLDETSPPSAIAAKHNEILGSMVEAGILAPREVSAVALDESPAKVLASLSQIERLLRERVGPCGPSGATGIG
jgi:hypothetical protein